MPLAIVGLAIIVAAVSIGFIRVDEATYMQWRLIFAAGEGLALSAGIMLIAFGMAQFHDLPR
jgi:hypothetical protein